MGKRVTVMLFGKMVRKGVQIDADATDGATIGKNLRWSNGDLVTEEELKALVGSASTTTDNASVKPTLWTLVLGMPAIIKSLAALATNGWMKHADGVITTASSIPVPDWNPVKKSVEAGEELTIPAGYELMLFDDFTMDGDITLDGDLVVLE